LNAAPIAPRTSTAAERTPALIPLLLGFAVLWIVLDRTAHLLQSFRGEAGLAVCAAVLVVAVAVEYALTRAPLPRSAADLGLRVPTLRAMTWAVVLALALLLFYPAFAFATGARLVLSPDWAALVVGLVAQGGVAEEVVFRGFLFRHIRKGRPFWRAAWLAAIPFTVVHAFLFLSLDFWIALASLLLALSLSFPFAWLFDRSGGSIWPTALLHAVIQGSIKLVDAGDALVPMSISWMLLCAALPWVVFFMRPGQKVGALPGSG
jgi:membrane protease YdiL (CAAX protease family)